MTVRVDFIFDVVCPYAYLAHTQVEQVCEGVELNWHPILLGGLFRVIDAGDGPMPGMPPSKAELNRRDMFRWAEHWEVPLEMPKDHPRRSVLAMRCVIASGEVPRAAKALFGAYWGQGRDVADDSVVRVALDDAGFDGAALVAAASEPDTKQKLRDNTDAAAAAGAFGVPTFVVHASGQGTDGPELIWGQDRLHFVTDAIARAGAA
jgi:2-hydroxychromene-2-carboxylate isomerase